MAFLTKGVTSKKVRILTSPTAYLGWVITGVAMAVAFAIIGLLYNVLTRPSIAVTNPVPGQQIEVRLAETGSVSFLVSGTSSGVYSRSNLRLYVLIHPAEPFASGWWIQQPAAVNRNGQWETVAWHGAREFPPQPGDKIDILIVVADSVDVAGRAQISDPKEIKPVTQSDIIRVSIGTIK